MKAMKAIFSGVAAAAAILSMGLLAPATVGAKPFNSEVGVWVSDGYLGDIPFEDLGSYASQAGTAPALSMATVRHNGEQFMQSFSLLMPPHWRVNGRSTPAECEQTALEDQPFDPTQCPERSRIGSAEGTMGVQGQNGQGVDITLKGDVYLVKTPGTDPVRLGLVFPVLPLPSGDSLNIPPIWADMVLQAGDYRILTTMSNLPRYEQISLLTLRIDLEAGEQDSLFRTPPLNSCDVAQDFPWSLTSWPDPKYDQDPNDGLEDSKTVTGTELVSLYGCGSVNDPFAPQVSVETSTTAAGQHPDLTVKIRRDKSNAYMTSMKFTMPVGMMGSPAATPVLCTRDQAQQNACPAESQVAEAVERVKVFESRDFLELPAKVYNAPPEGDELARFYMVALAPAIGQNQIIVLPVPLAVTDDTTRVVTAMNDIPPEFDVREVDFTFHGNTGADSGHPLLFNPSSCDAGALTAEFGSEEGDSYAVDVPYTATDCDALPYQPKVEMSLSCNTPRCAPEITAEVRQEPGEATTEETRFTIPRSFLINTQSTVATCSDEQAAAMACPSESSLGTVTAETPLLNDKLSGNLYLAEPKPGDSAIKTVLTQIKGAVNITLRGSLASSSNGIELSVEGFPQVPITSLQLKLDGGADRATLLAPMECGSHSFTSEMKSHSGKVATATHSIKVSGPGCEPRMSAKLDPDKAGAHPKLDLSIRPVKGGPSLRSASIRLGGKSRRINVRLPRGHKSRAIGTLSLKPQSGRELSARLISRGSRRVAVRGSGRTAKQSFKGMSIRVRRGQLLLSRMPDKPIKELVIHLNGNKRRLLTNPRRCGRVSIRGTFKDAEGQTLKSKTTARVSCSRKG